MYEINREVDEEFINAYIYKSINSYNQQLVLQIYESLYSPIGKIHYAVTFYICTKKYQGFQSLKSTGKDGIKSPIWAKNCIVDFIKFKDEKEPGNYITIAWEDSKRKRVYYYGLKQLGFYLGRLNNKETLLYKL